MRIGQVHVGLRCRSSLLPIRCNARTSFSFLFFPNKLHPPSQGHKLQASGLIRSRFRDRQSWSITTSTSRSCSLMTTNHHENAR